ncbi:heme-binding protein [Paenibacillus xylanexedens]|uniref:heme-binding protein n=1 Tax=Paenibacillus xylanexedens TaxID=528191 RepID=UPI0011A80A8A|nr:heme-binding protein [Paenibacillus xylanexedens]
MLDHAQKVQLLMYKEQEAKYQFDQLTQQDICQLGEYLKEISMKQEKPVAVEAALGNFVVFRFYPEGRGIFEETWIAGKRNTVMAFGISSKHAMLKMMDKGLKAGHSFSDLDPGAFVLSGGGFPLKLQNGLLVGSLCVSGLHDDVDHNLLIEALDRYFQHPKS